MTDVPRQSSGLTGQVKATTLARFAINVGHRMVYPFLPAIARGLNISLGTAGRLVALRSAMGLISPLFGPLSERFGRRRMMGAGMLGLVASALSIVLFPRHPILALSFLLAGWAKVVFDPNLQAFLGDRVPYERRALVMALSELAWGAAILLGAPAIGLGISLWGWRAGFVVVAILGGAGLVAVWRTLPDDRPSLRRSGSERFLPSIRLVLGNRSALAQLGITSLTMAANELLFVVYGSWMETQFSLSVTALGLATFVIGAAEITGELGVGGLVDRLGKRRSIGIGLLLTAWSYALLPWIATDLTTALVCLFVLFLCFEFTVVAILPLATELVPTARGTMMAWNVAAFSLGRVAGAAVGPYLWIGGGMIWNGLAAAGGTLLAWLLLVLFVRES